MRLFKKSNEIFNRDLQKIYDIGYMLKKEGKTDGERSQFEFMATLFLFIDLSLHRISLSLFSLALYIILKAVLNAL